jgi:diguanylate cyclase (GGDEF)-like protein/PAS domain S-box-containing protein
VAQPEREPQPDEAPRPREAIPDRLQRPGRLGAAAPRVAGDPEGTDRPRPDEGFPPEAAASAGLVVEATWVTGEFELPELTPRPRRRRRRAASSIPGLAHLRRRLLRITGWLIAALVPLAAAARVFGSGSTESLAPTLGVFAGAALGLALLRAGRLGLAATALVAPLGLSLLLRAATYDGLGGANFAWYGTFIMLGGMLGGRRLAWCAAAAGIATAQLLAIWGSGDAGWSSVLESCSVFLVAAAAYHALERALTGALDRSARAEAELRRANERYALAAEGAGYGAWEWDSETDRFWLAPGVQSIRGLPPDEQWYDRQEFRQILHPDDVEGTFTAFQEHVGGGRARLHVLCRLLHTDGRWIWVEGHGAARRSDDSKSVRLFGSLRDVTARKLMEQALHRQAFYDELTGLPNRSLFLDRLHQTIRRARRSGDPTYAVLFLDLDRFKIVNDSLGHDVGDQLLAEFGRRLQDAVRGVDTAARLGGDEFAVLLEGVRPKEIGLAVARIQERLDAAFDLAGRELFVGASIGVLEGSLDYDDPREALRDADLAMYSAKGGSHSVGRFKASLRDEAEHRLDLDQAIIRGLERDELEPWFQPMFHLRTGELRGFEALARWRRDDGRLVQPDEFIPRAEETGTIARIDRRIVEKACFAAAAWNLGRRTPVDLSVNISAWLFRDDDFPDFLARTLSRSGLDPACLHLELTESVFLADVPELAPQLDRLRAMGLRLAVDDFGTGYSSMSYLHRFQVHRIKVDRSFVQELGEDGPGPLCRAILSMAEALGVDVVAEGIETFAQQQALLELGCTQGQGWLLGRALPAAAAAELGRDDQEVTASTLQSIPAVERSKG